MARDFDPDSLRFGLPKAVSSLDWAISEGKGRVYIHCTTGLGRAPAVAIACMFWFCDMDLNTAYSILTSKRPCGPNKRALRGATYDLAKNDPRKEPFENHPEHAFEDVADWERKHRFRFMSVPYVELEKYCVGFFTFQNSLNIEAELKIKYCRPSMLNLGVLEGIYVLNVAECVAVLSFLKDGLNNILNLHG